jgi:hypothetical protein
MPRKSSVSSSVAHDGFLRSINVAFDASYPERVAHFRPTSKSVPVLRALLGQLPQRAFLISAPYGSGKSLVGAYALQVLENHETSRAQLRPVTERLHALSPALASSLHDRAKHRSARGLVLAMQGAQPDLSVALADAANASLKRARRGKGAGRPRTVRANADAVKTLQAIMEVAAAASFDSVLLVWDEFGRHLEELLSSGRAAELNQLQTMAELAARSDQLPLTLALLSHRGFGQYALGAPQAIRSEWVKVEGRFEAIQYIDDSKEMYRLVAETIADRRSITPTPAQRRWLHDLARQARSQGLFKELSVAAAQDLLEAAFPVHPIALHVLPRIAARISQNERTVFSFVAEQTLSRLIGLGQVYDYFADSMRADTGPGGAHRQYLETEAAIRRTTSHEEVEALKAACLLGLGLAGERGHVSRDLLSVASSRPGSTSSPGETVQRLIDNKLLLFRQHSNDVSVWHGADVDLRGALETTKERNRAGFRVLDFLRKELPAPTWRPVEFNDDFHVKRYFAGRYVTPAQFHGLCEPEAGVVAGFDGADGLILFVLAESASDHEGVRALASRAALAAGVIVAIPAREVSVAEAALEVACLEQMLRDPELIAKDPLVEVELRHLLDDARGYLHRAVDLLVTPQKGGPTFWHEGQSLQLQSAAELRCYLSGVTRKIYKCTPKINNELINRRRVSAPVANARKKLEMAILERAGLPDLGIQGNFPDASIFRTILVNTGLYREDGNGAWRFAAPDELQDPGLQAVWRRFEEFFQEPSEGRNKPFRQLFSDLQAPPIGLRSGLLPVFVACAFRAFPAAVSLRREGTYVEDILPTVVEDICRNPEAYSLEVLSLSASQRKIIASIQDVFGGFDPAVTRQADLIRTCFDCLRNWSISLPPVALSTSRLSQVAREFRAALQSQSDPLQFTFGELPRIFSQCDDVDFTHVLGVIKEELESVHERVRSDAAEVVRKTLDVGLDRREISLAETCQKWAKCFSIPDLQRAGSAQAIAFINRIEQRYDSDDLLLDSLAAQLVDQPTNRWDDGSLSRFDRALAEAVRMVEDEAVRLAVSGASNPVIVNNLSRLIEARIRDLYDNLGVLTGQRRARESLLRLTRSSKEEAVNGNDSRSA